MDLIAWIVLGLAGGAIARWQLGSQGNRAAEDIILGILGGVMGGLVVSTLLAIPSAILEMSPVTVVGAFFGGAIAVVVLRVAERPAQGE